MLTALVSAKGSPGVTTLALAMFNAWPGRALLVGADPAGDDLRQMLTGLDHGDGLLRLAADRVPVATAVWEEALALDPGTQQRLALFGIRSRRRPGPWSMCGSRWVGSCGRCPPTVWT